MNDFKKPEVYNEINRQLIEWFVTTGINPEIEKDIDNIDKIIKEDTTHITISRETITRETITRDTVTSDNVIEKLKKMIIRMTPTKKDFWVFNEKDHDTKAMTTIIPSILFTGYTDSSDTKPELIKLKVPTGSQFLPYLLLNNQMDQCYQGFYYCFLVL